MAAPSRNREDRASLKGKGKKPKLFLDKIDTAELATAIGGAQESRSLSKAGTSQQSRSRHDQTQESQKPRLSAAKAKLKETKALLAAQRSQKKINKAKRGRQRPQSSLAGESLEPTHSSTKPVASGKKKVSFA